MLIPHPDTVRSLLARYHEAQLQYAQRATYELEREIEDVSYTLCVSTATLTIADALVVADTVLRQAAGAAEAVRPTQASPAETPLAAA
ncbi:DUF5133 domain-containing protein [Streptomyces sp. NPDC060194]|uniref:DUF5133 domain-containing protein n=1 Tax=Streptomyces sp. NPDC060194 TaxID=3347069 RepID=UPI00365F1B1C